MKMYDCDVCQSAGSVNKWGFCEICGEDFEDPQSRIIWGGSPVSTVTPSEVLSRDRITSVGQDAA